MSHLHSIVYVSSATRQLTPLELEGIQGEAQARNRATSLTGLLLHCGGNFMQLLEGPPVELQKTFQRIKSSTRHHQIIELMSQPVEKREFSDWTMAFTQATAPEFLAIRNASWKVAVTAGGEASESAGRALLMDFWRSTR